MNVARIDLVSCFIDKPDFSAQFVENMDKLVYITDVRHIFDTANVVAEYGCGNDCYGCVFSSAYRDRSVELCTAVDDKFFQCFHSCVILEF